MAPSFENCVNQDPLVFDQNLSNVSKQRIHIRIEITQLN